MIDLQQRYEVIRLVCENLRLQPSNPKRVKNQRQVITSHKPKIRRIPSWCIDRLPADAQILGGDEVYTYVRH
ncbi:hypothetical protein FJ881_19875 [Escherichia albertii]|uniref:hypothetical protein n=1 Tax=Escherichia albertii TaxID=208962 RepID=UPI0017F65364|nr:hypothetical protein [Escherichia albertii]HBM9593769.1 hypothetical protein [Escherichia coli]